ncbi:hypothetical protein SAMN05421848_1687 [Kushneria avicenniae]|uniref:Uncharacterized protein n=2 Tax=Kushneria avicenniae TaxID=402385 RepID=A0A1I1JXC5_9GAMM|nr:hypothetical protein SAMN05421848_1687 [Kushneria avicenniae]
MMDKVSGYNTTRLELTLREDTPEAREALVKSLTPLMRKCGREITYRMKGRYGTHVERDEVPSFYRFHQGRLEIVMGGVLPGESLYMTRATLEALGARVPDTVQAQLKLRNQVIDALMLLPSSVIHALDSAKGFGSDRFLRQECSFSMEVQIDLDAVWDMLFGRTLRPGVLNGAVLESDANDFFNKQPLRVVGFSDGHIEANNSGIGRHLTGRIYLLPEKIDPANTPDCGRALVRWSSPELRAALLNALPGNLPKLVNHVELEQEERFSPWYSRGGWQTVFPEGAGKGQREACTAEEKIHTRTIVHWIRAGCNSDSPDETSCARLKRLRDSALENAMNCSIGKI